MAHLLFPHLMYSEKLEIYKTAGELGNRITVIAPEIPDWAAPYVHTRLDPEYRGETDEGLARLARYHEADPFDGVITFSDHGVMATARIAAALGLRGPSLAAAEAGRNKNHMREVLAAHGVPSPRTARVTNLEELLAAAGGIGFPGIYKPSGGGGSTGICFVSSDDELRQKYLESQDFGVPKAGTFFSYYPDEFIYEEFMSGYEVSVEGVVCDGDIQIAGVTDKWVDPERYFAEYQNAFPANIGDTDRDEAISVARQAVAAIGLDFSGFHIEVMLTPSGGKVVEVNARSAGGFIASHLVPLAGGDDLIRAAYNACLGIRTPLGNQADSGTCNRYILADRPGIVAAWNGLDEARASVGVVEIGVLKAVGAEVSLPPQSFSSHQVAHVVTRGETAAEAVENADRAAKLLDCVIV